MPEYKTIGFYIPVKMHAELKARLFYDDLPMTKFIRTYIEEYLNKNPLTLEFVDLIKQKHSIQNQKKRNKSIKLIEKGKQVESLFNLTGEEINDIYDVIESEEYFEDEVR